MLKKLNAFLQNNWFVILLIFIIGFLIYAQILGNEMFWDDDDFILKNFYIKDWAYLPKFFSENLIAGSHLTSNYWRPLLLINFAAQWHLWQDSVWGWHAVSILFHCAAASVLFLLITNLFKDRLLALLVTLIWLIHPAHSEVVSYANSLGDQQSTFFVLLGCLFFSRSLNQNDVQNGARHQFKKVPGTIFNSFSYNASIFCYIFGLMSKETAIVLPGLLFLIVLVSGTNSKRCQAPIQTQTQKEKGVRHQFKKVSGTIQAGTIQAGTIQGTIQLLWPFILIAIIYLVLRATILNFKNSFNFYNETNVLTQNIYIRLLTFSQALSYYTEILFTPFHLQVERIMEVPNSIFNWRTTFGLTLLIAMIAAAIKSLKTKPIVTFGIGWFLFAISPMSNVFIPINALLYEHFLYVPMIGIWLIIFSYLTPKLNVHPDKYFVLTIFLIFFTFFSIRTAWRTLDWKTAIRFYEGLAKHSPTYRVLNNLGMEYADKGLYDKALVYYTQAIEKDPTNAVGYHNLAGTLRDTGKTKEAKEYFVKAINLDPKFIFSYRALAKMLLSENNYDSTRAVLEQAIAQGLTPIEHLKLLAQIAERFNDTPRMKTYLTTAQSLTPNDPQLNQALQKLQ